MKRTAEPKMAGCHPDRPVYAREMCVACYFRDWRRLDKERRERIARRLRNIEEMAAST